MRIKTDLYFIAIIPEQKIQEELTSFKEDFAVRFNSKRALRIIPHITLKIPFRYPSEKHSDLTNWFETLKIKQAPFSVKLNGFGAFKKKKIIYVKPEINPALINLQGSLITEMKTNFNHIVEPDDEHFSPHMTIAYRDLSKEMFELAWKEYEHKNYEATFTVTEICLLKHNGSWKEVSTFKLR